MCTVSWLRQDDGYVLLCNRDELRTRLPASGPKIGRVRDVRFVAPVDGDQGGSWIGVNQYGLTLCLLNRYGESIVRFGDFLSRGLLIKDLLDSRSVEHVREQMLYRGLDRFQPFTLLALSRADGELLLEWTGNSLKLQSQTDLRIPLTSSSVKTADVPSLRQELFAQMAQLKGSVDLQLLQQFHRSHLPERGPVSICMHRDDAETVSLSIVTVNRDAIEFSYQPGSPCEAAPVETVFLQPGDFANQAAGL